MSRASSSTTARGIVDEVLGRAMTKAIWTGNYDKALPVTVQDFDLTAVLPAVFYMFRFGQRRGKGRFLEVFGGDADTMRQKKNTATIDVVASTLAKSGNIIGAKDKTEQAILGDLLLSYCLENANRALGRNDPVQRVAPPHYMASWVDLPLNVQSTRLAEWPRNSRRAVVELARSTIRTLKRLTLL